MINEFHNMFYNIFNKCAETSEIRQVLLILQ